MQGDGRNGVGCGKRTDGGGEAGGGMGDGLRTGGHAVRVPADDGVGIFLGEMTRGVLGADNEVVRLSHESRMSD